MQSFLLLHCYSQKKVRAQSLYALLCFEPNLVSIYLFTFFNQKMTGLDIEWIGAETVKLILICMSGIGSNLSAHQEARIFKLMEHSSDTVHFCLCTFLLNFSKHPIGDRFTVRRSTKEEASQG